MFKFVQYAVSGLRVVFLLRGGFRAAFGTEVAEWPMRFVRAFRILGFGVSGS